MTLLIAQSLLNDKWVKKKKKKKKPRVLNGHRGPLIPLKKAFFKG